MTYILAEHINNFVNTLMNEKEYNNSKADYIIKKVIAKEIEKLVDDYNYSYKGSVGNGRFAEIPWVGIFNNSINAKPQKGLYLVFLFTSELNGIYLSLNQGYSYLKEKYGIKKGKEIAKIISTYIRNSSFNMPERYLSIIKLNAKNQLGKGYEAANICSIYYDVKKMPHDEKLLSDIKMMLGIYEEIVHLMNNRSLEEFYEYIIASYKGQIVENDTTRNQIDIILNKRKFENEDLIYNKGPIDKIETIKDFIGNEHYPRSNRVALNALSNARFECEFDLNHKHFIRKSNNHNYTESHHLIPLSQHKDFEYSLDVEENICSLCSLCHDCIHYGTDEEREKILYKLYEKRKSLLSRVGLKISFEKLKKYYY